MKHKVYSSVILNEMSDIDCDIANKLRDTFNNRVITTKFLSMLTFAVTETIENTEIKAITFMRTDNGYRFDFKLYNDSTVMVKIVRSRTNMKPDTMIFDKLRHYKLQCHVGDSDKKMSHERRR